MKENLDPPEDEKEEPQELDPPEEYEQDDSFSDLETRIENYYDRIERRGGGSFD